MLFGWLILYRVYLNSQTLKTGLILADLPGKSCEF